MKKEQWATPAITISKQTQREPDWRLGLVLVENEFAD